MKGDGGREELHSEERRPRQMCMRDGTANAQRFRIECAAISQRVRSDITSDAQRFHIECAAISHRMRSDFSPNAQRFHICLLYTFPSPRDRQKSRMPSSA